MQYFNFQTDQWTKASRDDSLSLNDSTSSDDDRKQLSTRAVYQPKSSGDYENDSSQTAYSLLILCEIYIVLLIQRTMILIWFY